MSGTHNKMKMRNPLFKSSEDFQVTTAEHYTMRGPSWAQGCDYGTLVTHPVPALFPTRSQYSSLPVLHTSLGFSFNAQPQPVWLICPGFPETIRGLALKTPHPRHRPKPRQILMLGHHLFPCGLVLVTGVLWFSVGLNFFLSETAPILGSVVGFEAIQNALRFILLFLTSPERRNWTMVLAVLWVRSELKCAHMWQHLLGLLVTLL